MMNDVRTIKMRT